MAGPVLLLAITLTAVTIYFILGYKDHGFKFSDALMFGSIISATDPVAVVALLK
jgi:NhaP-type Na+/H+ or K+/H+ antiporter